MHKLPPLNLDKFITLDTLKLAKKVFKAPSNKLDYRSTIYGYGGKISQHWDDIIRVANGDDKAQERRIKYNIKDVVDTRKVFWRELDYYVVPKKIIKLLEKFITAEKIACPECTKARQSRYQVVEIRPGVMECIKCECQFKIKPTKKAA